MRILLLISAVFVLSIFSGYFIGEFLRESAENFVEQTFQQFEFAKDLEHYELLIFIFSNNVLKSFASMILGIGFGVVPVLFVILNGLIIGIVVAVIGAKMGLFLTAALLIPHGILEIPAILISSSYGVNLGIEAFRKFRGADVDLNRSLLEHLKKFAKIPLPMLLIAALIETYITPLVAGG